MSLYQVGIAFAVIAISAVITLGKFADATQRVQIYPAVLSIEAAAKFYWQEHCGTSATVGESDLKPLGYRGYSILPSSIWSVTFNGNGGASLTVTGTSEEALLAKAEVLSYFTGGYVGSDVRVPLLVSSKSTRNEGFTFMADEYGSTECL